MPKKSNSTINERLRELIAVLEESVSSFSTSLGLAQGTVSTMLTRSKSISSSFIEAVLKVYPSVNPEWLLTGNGTIFKEASAINKDQVGAPYYDVDFIGGFDLVLNSQTTNPEYYINFEPYNKPGVVWCNITGHSMEPAITHGDMIAIREVDDWKDYLTFGEIYAIVTTNDMRTVKKIRKSAEKEHYRLVPINTADYDEQDISKSKISKVFEVLGCMKRF